VFSCRDRNLADQIQATLYFDCYSFYLPNGVDSMVLWDGGFIEDEMEE
jgi:hypothetical protein